MSDDSKPQLTVGSLFAGIGGFDLGFERAGFQILFQVEIDEYCSKVLAKHWPHVARYGDIRTITELPYVDVLCGGFPCQDISNAGRREGLDGERSSLWREMLRCIRLVRPRYVVVENVAALLNRGMGRVLGDLSACGYDAEWDCIPASAVGAPHRRDRVWIVAYASEPGLAIAEPPALFGAGWGQEGRAITQCDWWATEPDVGRVAYGIPSRVDRLKGLGNALVPQIAEWIARRILDDCR